jgi:type I restriction enzyme, S subunit
MASEWREMRWGDLASLEYGRALRGYDAKWGQFPVFGTNGPIGWYDKALCTYPGVIIGRKDAYRGVHYSPSPFFVIDTAFYLEPKTDIDLRWAYYQLLTQDINSMDSGSAIPSTSRDAFYALPVLVPPLAEQRAIAHILGTLDDKIELNRRMNETLEGIARAIFKSWFVDFDPVRAKVEGRNLGLPKPVADLFPDSFEDSELGEIPKGWLVRPLPSAILVNPPRPLRKGDVAPYLEMANMPTQGHTPDFVINRPFGSGMRFAKGDTPWRRFMDDLQINFSAKNDSKPLLIR